MSDAASRDRKVVAERLADGMDLDAAAAEFLSDETFEAWYADTLADLTRALQ